MPKPSQHGPLAAVILAKTGEDIRACGQCQSCFIENQPSINLSIGEFLQAAARNDTSVLSSQTLWNYDPAFEVSGNCPQGINLAKVMAALRVEAELRGAISQDP